MIAPMVEPVAWSEFVARFDTLRRWQAG